MSALRVPFFRPEIGEGEIEEVVAVLRSGWLTTGPRVAKFETRFAVAVGAKHAIGLNSCTAALHLAVEALGLTAGQGVLVPSLTFAATAEVVRYQGAHPILVDCDPDTLQIDLGDAAAKLQALRTGDLPVPSDTEVVGIIPVHMGGAMIPIDALAAFCKAHGLWRIDDAAHTFPAAWRKDADSPWLRCGEGTADITCFSFYANKTITTGEGGMAVTSDADLAARMRVMALHGLSKDAWTRFSGGHSWDYRIVAPGFKYNLTDVAAAIGLHQLDRAHDMRSKRQKIVAQYQSAFAGQPALDLPVVDSNRQDAWYLFALRLNLDALDIDRNVLFDALSERGVGCSVHYRPLHMHPYYEQLGWTEAHCPVATRTFGRLISLPLFSAQTPEEVEHVITTVRSLCEEHAA